MKVEYLSPDELIPYEKNAKQHLPAQVDQIANSIRRFGWQQPIVIDKNKVVIIGHGRLMAAKQIMNTYFFDVDNPVVFSGTLDEDMVASLRCGLSGELLLTSIDMMIIQMKTQANKGGLTDAYLDFGTYTKSFYAVMMNPSICKIAMMGDKHMRIHHQVKVSGMDPVIISGRYRKKRETPVAGQKR